MKIKIHVILMGLLTIAAGAAYGDAIIADGNVKLGVDDYGQLNVAGGVDDVAPGTETIVGLRYLPPSAGGDEYESTSHGCLCEGWGVAADGASGYANNALGIAGLTLISFTSDATSATSVVSMGDLVITHAFALAAETDNLYRVTVTIENTGATDIADLRYRRTMDWDTSPTPFQEYVTIGGTAAATSVLAATDDGFCSSNPLAPCGTIVAGSSGDFVASGPADHGANFDFGFGGLLAGESFAFDIFYGGADSGAAALAALGAVGAEVFSLGWSFKDVNQDGFDDETGALTPTFIFGFAGVGGDPLPPVGVPEPGTLGLLCLGLGLLFRSRRRSV